MYKQYALAGLVAILYILLLFLFIHIIVYFESAKDIIK